MSNALKRKSKKMQPVGYSKKEISSINKYSKERSRMNNTTYNAYLDVRLIAYQILHDKYGFGQKRIIRVEQTIDKYREGAESGELLARKLEFYLKEKCKIDVREQANMVPFRERFALTERKIVPASQQSAGQYLVASICNYFSLLGVCLKTQFKFSARQINEVFEWIRYYINTLSRVKQFDLTIRDIAECLAEECNYCDSRFVGA